MRSNPDGDVDPIFFSAVCFPVCLVLHLYHCSKFTLVFMIVLMQIFPNE